MGFEELRPSTELTYQRGAQLLVSNRMQTHMVALGVQRNLVLLMIVLTTVENDVLRFAAPSLHIVEERRNIDLHDWISADAA